MNALLGGVLHATTDPGTATSTTSTATAILGPARIASPSGASRPIAAGDVTIGPERFVTGQVEAAIPQVAMTDDGTLGVFYYTFDGFSGSGFPNFTAHLAVSSDLGTSFADHRLLTFLSPAAPDGIRGNGCSVITCR